MLIDGIAKLNRSLRNAVFAAIVIIAAIGMYDWIVAPHAAYLFAAQCYGSLVGNIAKKNEVISKVVTTKKEKLQELQDRFAQLESTLFTAKEGKEFFSDLQVTSEQAGCSLISLEFKTSKLSIEGEKSKNTSGIVAHSAMLGLVSTYNNIIKLVERLQGRTQKVWIDSMEMESLEDNSAGVKCDMTITVYTVEDKDTVS